MESSELRSHYENQTRTSRHAPVRTPVGLRPSIDFVRITVPAAGLHPPVLPRALKKKKKISWRFMSSYMFIMIIDERE